MLKIRYTDSLFCTVLQSLMQFELKPIQLPQQHHQLGREQVKLNGLIEEIEQQKILLMAWQQAKDEIQAYSQKALMPAYRDLYATLYAQMQSLWNSLGCADLSKSDAVQVDSKIQALVSMLKDSKMLAESQLEEVAKLYAYYAQAEQYAQSKKNKKKVTQCEDESFQSNNDDADDVIEDWNPDHHLQAKKQAKLKRQQEKQAQAEKRVNQSLKTVYLKIAAMIHPDREQDEFKKAEKTELLQRANQAYEQEDLFFLLKLQLEVEQSKQGANKGLTADQVKYYQQALKAQSQALKQQIQHLIDSLVWSEKAKIAVQKSKGKLNIKNLYQQIDVDVSALKQQLKWEKRRLIEMNRLTGLSNLIEHSLL